MSEPEGMPLRCPHKRSEIRKRTQSNGITVAARQCLDCGGHLGCVPKKSVFVSQLPPWDEEMNKRWWDRFHSERQAEYEAKRSTESQEWWDWYNAYLESPEWRAKRRQVLARAGSLCEGCRERPAVQVHHLTYERVGHEMLFDLVAVCTECHEAIHAEKQGSRDGI